MPLDLSHPRHILPFSSSSTLPPATESTNSKIDSPATSQPPIQGQRAIQLKLNDQVLAQLVELARTSGVNLERGKVQLDLRDGHQPVSNSVRLRNYALCTEQALSMIRRS